MDFNATPTNEMLQEKPATLEQWKAKAEQLWSLLDDIDTYSDRHRPENTNYYRAVQRKADDRHKILKSDGYRIVNTEE